MQARTGLRSRDSLTASSNFNISDSIGLFVAFAIVVVLLGRLTSTYSVKNSRKKKIKFGLRLIFSTFVGDLVGPFCRGQTKYL